MAKLTNMRTELAKSSYPAKKESLYSESLCVQGQMIIKFSSRGGNNVDNTLARREYKKAKQRAQIAKNR
jgi:hypothetical protein